MMVVGGDDMGKAKPKCPECGVEGLEHIISEDSVETSKAGDPWFNIVFCDQCGHVYGVFAKYVNRPSVRFPGFHEE